MADVVRFDELRRKRSRRRRILREVQTALGRFERSMVAGRPEYAAAELVTVGRQLVRLLEAFDELSGAAAEGRDVPEVRNSHEPQDRAAEAASAYGVNPTLQQRRVTHSRSEGGNGQSAAHEAGPGGGSVSAAACEEPDACGTDRDLVAEGSHRRLPFRVLSGQGGLERPPREMSHSEFWEMIALALEEIVDTLESFTAHLALLVTRRPAAGVQGGARPPSGSQGFTRRGPAPGRPRKARSGSPGKGTDPTCAKRGARPMRRRDGPR